MAPILSLGAAFLAALSLDRSRFGDPSSNSILTVTVAGGAPRNLSHSDALFGAPTWGGSGLVARLYYPASHGPDGCSAANLTSDPDMPHAPFVLLLDRGGGCSFADKVRSAQGAGASAAVVIDSFGLCDGRSAECGRNECGRCPIYSSSPQCECALPFMAAEGSSGADIVIPSALIPKVDGEALRAPASVGARGGPPHAIVSMSFDMPNPDGKPAYELWFSPNDAPTGLLRAGLAPYLPYLAPHVDFTPRPFIFDGRALGCAGPSPVFECKGQCTNDGWYCAIDPDGSLDAGATGADVVREAVRSTCAAAQAGAAGAGGTGGTGGLVWWSYSDAFQSQCGGGASGSGWGEECSYAAMAGVGLDPVAARACVAAANATTPGSAPGDFTNTVLQAAVDARGDMGIVSLPSSVVNGVLLRGGGNTAGGVLAALCAGFAPGSAPAVCGCLSVPLASLPACAAGGGAGGGGGGGGGGAGGGNGGGSIPAWAGVLIAVAVLGAAASAVASARAALAQRRLQNDVNALMHDYYSTLEGGGGESNKRPVHFASPGGGGLGGGGLGGGGYPPSSPSSSSSPSTSATTAAPGAAHGHGRFSLPDWASAVLSPPPAGNASATPHVSAGGSRGRSGVV